MEIKYKLQSFGIPMDLFPIDDDSKLLGLTDFVARRSSIENERRVEQGSRILAPGKLDILLGRGKPMQNWCGNLQLATMLLDNADRRNTDMNRRGAKNDLSRDIVEIVKESGGRFLKREKGAMEWIEVDDIIAREKVNNGFRNQRQLLVKATPEQTRKDESAGREIYGTSIDPKEECTDSVEDLLTVASPPNIHCGEKRRRPMDAPT
jgi:hypothetical protein